jgi:hypothetical protein
MFSRGKAKKRKIIRQPSFPEGIPNDTSNFPSSSFFAMDSAGALEHLPKHAWQEKPTTAAPQWIVIQIAVMMTTNPAEESGWPFAFRVLLLLPLVFVSLAPGTTLPAVAFAARTQLS